MRVSSLLALAILILATGAVADTPQQIREQLTPLYHQVQGDPQFRAFQLELERGAQDRAVVDRYLEWLPMSPLELYEIDMFLKRYETVIPVFLHQWHVRWIELHEQKARALYGDGYVDQKLVPVGAFPGGPLVKMATVGTNRNVAFNFPIPPTQYQGEIQVAVNPNNRLELVAAANTWDTIGGTCANGVQAVFFSSDGGVTWGYTCAPLHTAYGLSFGCAANFVFGSDPAVTWNDQGEVFLNHMMLCASGAQTRFAIVVARSTDGGATWSPQGVVVDSWATAGVVEDKNFYAIDNNPSSPFYGRHYTCWDRNNNERAAFSTNNGATWTTINLPTTPSTGAGSAFDLACELEVQRNGTVHVVYDTLRCTANCNNEQMFYSRSTNGGVTWSAPVLVQDFNLVGFSGANCASAQDNRCINPFGAIAVDNSGGPCDGTLYTVFSDWTAGGVNTTDVWMRRSTDGGVTWQPRVRINDDGPGGNVQFHPFVQVDQSTGYPVVAWHDARNSATNTEVDFFVTHSRDCGLTFETNTQVSQPSAEFNANTISFSNLNTAQNPLRNPNQYGEYLGLDVLDRTAYIAWTDSRHYFPGPVSAQRENVGFAAVRLGCTSRNGRTSGRFNQPVPLGTNPGGIQATLFDLTSTPVYTWLASLTQTSATGGTFTGTLSDGTAPDPDYDVVGTYVITQPATGTLPDYGRFSGGIFIAGTSTQVGKIGGEWKDYPPTANVGKLAGAWKICD